MMYNYMFGEENEPNDTAVCRRGDEQTNRELFMSFFERGDQHQICGGSSKCSLSIFFGEPAEHECRGKS